MSDNSQLRLDVRACLMPGFTGLTAPQWVRDALADGLESVCIYGANVRDAAQLRALGAELRSAAPHALIAIDEEGGEVTRLHYVEGSPYPGAAVLGRINDTALTERVGAEVAADVLSAGFNLVLGPVADVNSNPNNPVIGSRSFAGDPTAASPHVAAMVRGIEQHGAVSCPKHFPGHGDTAQDSHLALPVVDATAAQLNERDLPPFAAAFAAGARTVMTSHILLPEIDPSGPATFSKIVLQDILRGQLGFTGVIVSDALDMHGASGEIGIPEAAVRALAAGCELLCLGTDNTAEQLREIEDHVIKAVTAGTLRAETLSSAATKVRDLAASAAPGAAPAVPSAPDAVEIQLVQDSFAGVEAARAWLQTHEDAAVIRVETTANMAVGDAPWGPFAAAEYPLADQGPIASAFLERAHRTVTETAPLPWPVSDAASSGVIVIGRELHRRDFARSGIDALRAAGVPVLTVECGWPGTDAHYADLACYGSSSLVGAALLALFEEQVS